MTDQIRITEAALPGILAEIARIASVPIAVAIARKYGGGRLYLRHSPRRTDALTVLVGIQAARLICGHWPGINVEVPSAKSYLNWYDARRLRSHRDADGEPMSYDKIAKRLNISTRRVYDLLKGFTPGDADSDELDEAETADRCPVCGSKPHGRRRHRGDDRQLELALPEAA